MKIQIPSFAEGDFAIWQKKFECLAVAKDWNEEDKSKYLPLFLEGEAFQCHDSLPGDVKKSYQSAVNELQKVFGSKREQTLAVFQQLKLEVGKSPRLHLLNLRSVCAKCYPSIDVAGRETLVFDQLKKSIPPQFMTHILSNPALDDADKVVEVLDKLMNVGGVAECHTVPKTPEGDDALQNELRQIKEQVALLAARGTQARGNRIQCYRCGGFGHISRYCQKYSQPQAAGKATEASGGSHRRL